MQTLLVILELNFRDESYSIYYRQDITRLKHFNRGHAKGRVIKTLVQGQRAGKRRASFSDCLEHEHVSLFHAQTLPCADHIFGYVLKYYRLLLMFIFISRTL